jgi:hypothetical protein
VEDIAEDIKEIHEEVKVLHEDISQIQAGKNLRVEPVKKEAAIKLLIKK